MTIHSCSLHFCSFNLRGVCVPHRGQVVVDPGVIIMGHKGDPNRNSRPAFAKNGTFMVFRKLEQAVLPFEAYMDKNYKTIRRDEPGDGTFLTRKERKDLFGARLMGRFKSVCHLFNAPSVFAQDLFDKGCSSGLDALPRRFPVYPSREN